MGTRPLTTLRVCLLQVALATTYILGILSPGSAVAAARSLATFSVINDGGALTDPRVVSFGQMFPKAAIRPGDPITVTLNGTPIPSQLNAKAFYPDGTIRHAVVAIELPRMRSAEILSGRITTSVWSFPYSHLAAAPDLHVDLHFQEAESRGQSVDIGLRALIHSSTSPLSSPWLNGPLLSEQRYYAPIVNGIQVVFDVRRPAAGAPEVDIIIHNDLASDPDITTRIYDVRITLAGRSVYSIQNFAQYAHSTWHKMVYCGGYPPPRIIPNFDLLVATGAIPRYLKLAPDPEAMRKLAQADPVRETTPLSPAGLTKYMPTTGGRADLGPLPTWAVFYLLDPSRQNRDTLFADADAAGSIPWHVRDPRTQGPIDIDAHPEVWLDGRSHAVPGVLARKFYISGTNWQPDDAHQPSLTYLPYLLTGSQYYRDELAMQAGYVLLALDPQYRGYSKGLVLGSQVRAVAWDLRTLATAAFILPSADPLQSYFNRKLNANLDEIINRYIERPTPAAAGELEGYLPGPYAVNGATAPWQNDYLAIVLGWIDSMGYTQAKPILEWMTNFVAGLFTNGNNGFNPIYGTPYFLYVQTPNSGRPIATWAQAFQLTFDPATKPIRQLDYPSWAGGYAALARAALASIISVTHSSKARKAYRFVSANTPEMDDNYPKDPTFAIAPDETNTLAGSHIDAP